MGLRAMPEATTEFGAVNKKIIPILNGGPNN